MSAPVMTKPAPVVEADALTQSRSAPALPWVTIVWNDPVNLMSYVTYVFRTYFGYPKGKAEALMNQVHEDGKAVVASGSREEMERDTEAMHGFGLWATCQPDGQES